MALLILARKFDKNIIQKVNGSSFRYCSFAASTSGSENVPETLPKVEYPPILDLSERAIKDREKFAWHQEVQKVQTIEEKLVKVNVPYYYGLRTIPLNDQYVYNCLPYMQHWTRTQIEKELPGDWYPQSAEEVDALVNYIREEFIDAILFQYEGYRRESDFDVKLSEEEKHRRRTESIVKDLNKILIRNLSVKAPHLLESEVDIEPRHEAFWMCGGIEPPIDKKIWLERIEKQTEEEKKEPTDRPFQYFGKPILSLRNRFPLDPVVNDIADDSFDVEAIPKHRNDPQGLGYERVYQHVTNIPGFWPGSEHEFGQLCYHNRHKYKVSYNEYDTEDKKNALIAQGILTSFGWCMAQAAYQGFTTYNELTYPLTTQTVITDGQNWSFFVYQLNTIVFETLNFDKSQRANKCWATEEMKLFETIDENGKIIGFNDDVLRQLIKFYLATPKERSHDMKPYVDKECETIADIDHLERREFLETHFKHLFSRRPRHRKDLIPEVYLWEWIYKIKFNTRPMDARRRFFELNQDPWDRKLSDTKIYVPKQKRPGGPKSKQKFATQYWP